MVDPGTSQVAVVENAESISLRSPEIHIWRIDLTQPIERCTKFEELLASEEIEKRNRFCFQRDRVRFAISHVATRDILSRYVRANPRVIRFRNNAFGKPELSPDFNLPGISFNLSHSGNWAILALAHSIAIGIDIEEVHSDFLPLEVAQHFFSELEVRVLSALSESERMYAFFECWTRKEAYLKARGGGLAIPLGSFDVSFGIGQKPLLLAVRPECEDKRQWTLYDCEVDEGYKAALIAEGHNHQLKYWNWIIGYKGRLPSAFRACCTEP